MEGLEAMASLSRSRTRQCPRRWVASSVVKAPANLGRIAQRWETKLNGGELECSEIDCDRNVRDLGNREAWWAGRGQSRDVCGSERAEGVRAKRPVDIQGGNPSRAHHGHSDLLRGQQGQNWRGVKDVVEGHEESSLRLVVQGVVADL
jgi:hypothetical protein